MDFELTADQRAVQTLTRELAEAEIVPNAASWDREHFPDELFPKLAELGLMGVCVPEEYGGAGADFLSYVLVLEELSRADAGVGVTVAVHTSATTLPTTFGSEEQRSRFVPPLPVVSSSGIRAHGVGLRIRCRVTRTTAQPRRGRLADHRLEAVDHERIASGHIRPLRPNRSRDSGRAAFRASCSTPTMSA